MLFCCSASSLVLGRYMSFSCAADEGIVYDNAETWMARYISTSLPSVLAQCAKISFPHQNIVLRVFRQKFSWTCMFSHRDCTRWSRQQRTMYTVVTILQQIDAWPSLQNQCRTYACSRVLFVQCFVACVFFVGTNILAVNWRNDTLCALCTIKASIHLYVCAVPGH